MSEPSAQGARANPLRSDVPARLERNRAGCWHSVGRSLSAKEVLFLERTLEKHLGIMNRPVPGEMNPDEVSG